VRTSWHDIWGCARGPVARLAPQTRILAGTVLFAACLVAPISILPGIAVVAFAAAVWLVACRPPGKVARTAILFGLSLFLPCLLLTPLIRLGSPATDRGWSRAFEISGSLFARGFSGMLVSLATVTTLSAGDVREGLMRLPVPRIASAILLQILHQTATLVDETREVAAAMAVRGASGGGRAAWRVLVSLPQVWLPRVLLRADGVAAAMELRGYDVTSLRAFDRAPLRAGDGIALALAGCLLALALALRWSVTP
jgi:energy-coupling factor transporter transmembrane protein EcfT